MAEIITRHCEGGVFPPEAIPLTVLEIASSGYALLATTRQIQRRHNV